MVSYCKWWPSVNGSHVVATRSGDISAVAFVFECVFECVFVFAFVFVFLHAFVLVLASCIVEEWWPMAMEWLQGGGI